MPHRIPTINKKIFRTPRERFISNSGGAGPRLSGRAALYQGARGRASRKSPAFAIRVAIAIIAAVLVVQGFFQIPLFRITNVEVEGIKYVPIETVRSFIDSELHRRRLLIFKNSNYFLFAARKMKKRLEDEFYVEVLQMKKKFPHSLSLTVRERISAFVVQTPDGYFTLGTDGAALQDVTKPSASQVLIADERSQRERSVPVPYLEQATSIAEDWGQTVPQVGIAAFHLTDDASKIIISTTRGFRVYLDPGKPLHSQILRLAVYLQDREFVPPVEYIDLRYDETLYVR